MNDLFHVENPFIQLLSRVMDMIIVNLVFIVCCIPIVTIGPSIAAATQVMQDMVYDTEGKLLQRYFHAFKANFKQTFLLGIVMLFVYVALFSDLMLIMAFFSGTGALIMYLLLAVLLFIVTSTFGYLFPLIVRYDNTMREHIYNALIISITKFPKSLLICVIILFPFALVTLFPMLFVQTLVFWFIIGFSFSIFMINTYQRPIFQELERKK